MTFMQKLSALTSLLLLAGIAQAQTGTATASALNTTLQGLTGCTTAGYAHTPAGNDCVAVTSTAAGVGTLINQAQYDVLYSGGTTSAVGGAAINGFQYDSTTGVPAAATATNLGALMNVTGIVYGNGTAAPGAATATQLGALASLTANAIPKSGGTSAALTTSSASDNGTTFAVTEPLTAGNTGSLPSGTTTGTNSWKSVGFTFPSVPASTTRQGICKILWNMSSTSYTIQFGIYNSSAPTSAYGSSRITYAAAGTQGFLQWNATATSSSSPTTITATTTAGTTTLEYLEDIEVQIVNASTGADVVTVEAESSNASGTWTIEPGSWCAWLP
jgi:hypothetical protein